MSALANRLARDLDGTFPALVEQFQNGIYTGARRLRGEAAEDITQETFLRAYRALTDMPSNRIAGLNLTGWLWTIALNLCRNDHRSSQRKPTVRLVSEDLAAPAQPSLEEQLTWDARLAELSLEHRIAVVLKHVVGLTYKEVADVTGRPVGTVKSDVSRGLDGLREIIGREES